MADNDTPTCDYCGTTLDESRDYTISAEIGRGWDKSHDDCQRAFESWASLDAVHRGWCHAHLCDRGPTRPFSHE